MAIRLPCPCGQEVTATPEAAGKSVRCPGCGQMVAVPALGKPVGASRGKPTPPPGRPIPVRRPQSASTPPPAKFWAKVAVGAGAGLVLVAFIALLLVCFSSPGQEAQGPSREPVALIKPVSPPEPKTNPPPTQPQQKIKEVPSGARVSTTAPEQKESPDPEPPPKRKGKFIRDKNSVLPLEILAVEEVKIPYNVRRLKLPENQPGKLRLAVIPAGYDNIGQVLAAMELPFTNIVAENLNSLDKLREFDVLFLNCGGGWAAGAPRNVRKFVEMGGTVYASDLQYDSVRNTFPEMKGPNYRYAGAPQKLKATVVDAGLVDYLGTGEIELHFNAGGWRAAFFDKDKTSLYLEGEPTAPFNLNPFLKPIPKGKAGLKPNVTPFFPESLPPPKVVPLLVKFRCQAGSVIYTSFHTSANLSELEKKLLQYLVFAAVNAKAESQIRLIMVEAGFAAQNLRNYQVSLDRPVPLQTTDHQGGGLQIAVGFENLGARLRLTLTAPDGQKIDHEETGMFLVEVPKAPAGNWQYAVAAEAVPFQNFPIVLAVGKTK